MHNIGRQWIEYLFTKWRKWNVCVDQWASRLLYINVLRMEKYILFSGDRSQTRIMKKNGIGVKQK